MLDFRARRRRIWPPCPPRPHRTSKLAAVPPRASTNTLGDLVQQRPTAVGGVSPGRRAVPESRVSAGPRPVTPAASGRGWRTRIPAHWRHMAQAWR